jgi:hypothetical protein
MAETTVENQICQICGADVRPGALFCYSCGKAVMQPEKAGKTETTEGGVRTDHWFGDDKEEDEKKFASHTGPIVKPNDKPFVSTNEKPAETNNNKPSAEEKSKLKPAVPNRQKSGVQPKNVVEVVWEKPENAPNLWFILVGIALGIFAVGILWAMLYLR